MKSFVRWKVGLWALLVLLAAALMACGLADSFSFIGRSPTYFEGHRMVLLAALAFGAASVWAGMERRSLRVIVSTALPAVVVGGLAVQLPDGLLQHIAGLALIPIALLAMLVELPAEIYAPPDGP
jgi:hypothetical protein